ncbi:hypothetical protein LTR37_018178 [Vermiconidia calcicola]|uniref:Uncharacterized protein n=1 Tax=Vermiconidia calcicola TaxID=1690605 RepID=A0ACC3MHV4_9PEZI|nr:hypothetical protein LTR37_018178 [Vermiconidia calcicola]
MAAKSGMFRRMTDTGDLRERMQRDILNSDYMRFKADKSLMRQQLDSEEKKNAMLPWLKAVEIVEVEKLSDTTGRSVCRFPVQHEYLNPAMGLHGGMSAAIFDTGTTWVLDVIRKPGFWEHFGTTRTLNLTFLRPAAEGEMLRLESEIVQAGKRLCLIKGVLRRESDGAIVSTCEHQKYNTDADMPKV